MKAGGAQAIHTNDGCIIPLDVINGLPHIKMTPNTNKEWDELPHVILTCGASWNPCVMDDSLTDKDNWCNTLKQCDDGVISTPFDECGNYHHRTTPDTVQILPPIQDNANNEIEAAFHNTKENCHIC